MSVELAKVWPLKPGLSGYDPTGFPVELAVGLPGWMEYSEAQKAQAEGDVQLMAGVSPQDLIRPSYNDRAVTAKSEPKSRSARGRYNRRDMRPDR